MQQQTVRLDRRRAASATEWPATASKRADLGIAVIDPVPLFARGLAGVLREHGFTSCTSASLDCRDQDLLVLGIRREEDWTTMSEIVAVKRAFGVIAIVPDGESTSFLRAIAGGAIGVAARTAAMGQIVAVVESALVGLAAVPPKALQVLAHGYMKPKDRPSLTDDQMRCLAFLADGFTVAQVGRQCGYSERETYRMLTRLYRALGVQNRSQALVRAARDGLIGF